MLVKICVKVYLQKEYPTVPMPAVIVNPSTGANFPHTPHRLSGGNCMSFLPYVPTMT
ncbi:MAG: hypothetical protein HC919_10685 [Oscillatoriales cyanobacterium SM2_2_1]|nr:hypothetical protein [Oscillatoriales cyanobacterium SM2_2_1]